MFNVLKFIQIEVKLMVKHLITLSEFYVQYWPFTRCNVVTVFILAFCQWCRAFFPFLFLTKYLKIVKITDLQFTYFYLLTMRLYFLKLLTIFNIYLMPLRYIAKIGDSTSMWPRINVCFSKQVVPLTVKKNGYLRVKN